MIFNPFATLFRKPSPKELVAQQLHESQVLLLEYRKDAEYYQAMATMFERRIDRLKVADSKLESTPI